MANIVFQDGTRSIPTPVLTILQPTVHKAYFAKMSSEDVDTEGNSTGTQEHTVIIGDIISNIAPKYNTTEAKIIELNDNITQANKHLIQLGQKITVPKKNTKKKISFTQINEGEMGNAVYIVVETEHLTSEKVLINIHQGEEDVLVKKGELITVQVEGVDKTKIETSVGNLCEDDSISNGDDFVDWAVIKIKLEPSTDTLKK